MDRDRSWMYSRLQDGFITSDYFNGVEDFISFAFSQHNFLRGSKIRCPCTSCQNSKWQIADDVRKHLFLKGFCYGYTTWTLHGEQEIGESSQNQVEDEPMCQVQNENPYARMVMDAALGSFDFDANQGSEPRVEGESPNPSASSFYSLLRDADEPLWSGCLSHTKLSAVSQLLNCKAEFNMSESCFNRLITVVKSMMPTDECLPEDFYRMKKKLTKLGLGYVQIHACPKNCMLFYGETIELEYCSICGHPRYKASKSSTRRQKKIPSKILRYFPLIPRLQRLYMSAKIAEHMTWHAYNQSNDGVLRHPVDGEAWQHFNLMHESFAMEPRNVRLGLCADGFNPFGPATKPYSVWPVMLTVYNLPPWMCMKKPYIFLSMVIPGNPNQNIDVFLRPLIDDLKKLWNDGCLTYDAYKKQNFVLRAALLWTINDFPAYGILSGWSTHGRLSCPYCMERTKSFILNHGRKPCFFYCHRQFLPSDHPFRRQRDKFKIRVERDSPIPRLSGEEILMRLNSLPNLTFGMNVNNERIPGYGHNHHWVKKSIFWELEYWHTNLIRHNLDVMHIERNVFENVFNTIMDVKGKTKDNIKRMKAMKEACVTNIKECKGMEREWITKDVWDALIDNEWGTDAWQSKSGKAKANRLTEKEGSITKHTGGSRPFAVHGIKLAEKLGREVGYSEIFQVTHKRKGGEGEFVDNKSRVVSEKYNAALVDKYGDDTSSHPSFDGQSWSDAIGGLKTTRTSVYGFGSRVDSRQLFSAPSTGPSTSDSACGPFTYQSFTTNELILQNQLAEKVENLESTVLGIQQGQAGLQSKLDKILELERGHPTLFSQTSQSGINSRDAGVEGIERGGQGEDA